MVVLSQRLAAACLHHSMVDTVCCDIIKFNDHIGVFLAYINSLKTTVISASILTDPLQRCLDYRFSLMNNISKNTSSAVENTFELWLDKLWFYLFDDNSGGLMSPGQIRREHRDRARVRQLEMSAILQVELELNDVHRGLKSIDLNGNLISTPAVDTIATHRIIENTTIDQPLDVSLGTPAALLRSVAKELTVRNLERSLNLRKIAILAESQILESRMCPVSTVAVNAEWMMRWRDSAENVFSPELQMLWAKMLVLEMAQPGSFNLGLMPTLLQLSLNDLEMIRIAGKYAFPRFIYHAGESYFSTDLHRTLFDVLEDLGLLVYAPTVKHFNSSSTDVYQLILCCRGKALKMTHSDANKVLAIPVLRLSRIGNQLMSLFECKADMAYLFDLAGVIKQQGFNVALGDLSETGSTAGFIERMSL